MDFIFNNASTEQSELVASVFLSIVILLVSTESLFIPSAVVSLKPGRVYTISMLLSVSGVRNLTLNTFPPPNGRCMRCFASCVLFVLFCFVFFSLSLFDSVGLVYLFFAHTQAVQTRRPNAPLCKRLRASMHRLASSSCTTRARSPSSPSLSTAIETQGSNRQVWKGGVL
jgi:hypothetical protein